MPSCEPGVATHAVHSCAADELRLAVAFSKTCLKESSVWTAGNFKKLSYIYT